MGGGEWGAADAHARMCAHTAHTNEKICMI